MPNHGETLFVILFFVTLFLGGALFFYWNRFLEKRKMKKIKKQGSKGEARAKKYLLKHGYDIIDEQVQEQGRMWINEEEVVYEVRADFLVRKNGETSIVEVKTGDVATDPTSIHTRRQLLEYSYLYDVDSILFFDAESSEIMTIQFPQEDTSSLSFKPFLIGVVLGSIIAFLAFIALFH